MDRRFLRGCRGRRSPPGPLRQAGRQHSKRKSMQVGGTRARQCQSRRSKQASKLTLEGHRGHEEEEEAEEGAGVGSHLEQSVSTHSA